MVNVAVVWFFNDRPDLRSRARAAKPSTHVFNIHMRLTSYISLKGHNNILMLIFIPHDSLIT